MNKCPKCNIEIADETISCPLCGHVLTQRDASAQHNTYPRVRQKKRRHRLAMAIYFFCAIVCGLVCVYTDFALGGGVTWSLFVVGALAYGYLTMRFSLVKHMNYRGRFLLQTLVGLLFVIVIDVLTGPVWWSFYFVIPGTFIFIDIGVLVMMIANSRNWQSYISMQLFTLVLCSSPYIVHFIWGLELNPVHDAALMITVVFFLGTVIIGGKRARDELRRRFHS